MRELRWSDLDPNTLAGLIYDSSTCDSGGTIHCWSPEPQGRILGRLIPGTACRRALRSRSGARRWGAPGPARVPWEQAVCLDNVT